MKLEKILPWCLLCLLCPMATSMAKPEAPERPERPARPADYGWQIPLTVTGSQGVVGLRLPPEVYLHAQSAQLNDIRVFDASGASIPFAIYQAPLQTRAEHRTIPARIFPVYGTISGSGSDNGAAAAPGQLALNIQTGANGSIISVKTGASTAQTSLHSLILDLGGQAGQGAQGEKPPLIEALHFTAPVRTANNANSGNGANSATNANNAQYSAQVWLEASDDLKQWEPLGTSELSWLSNDANQTLANDRLKFEPRHLRYARLSWRAGEPVLFGAIDAETVQQVSETAKLAQMTLAGSPGKNPQEWQYALSRALPVEKIGLQLSEENIVFPAALGHYQELPSHQAGKPTTWRFVPDIQSTFYQLTQDGKTRRFTELTLPVTHAEQWVLRPQGATASTLASRAAPALTVYWQAAQLIFVTSGKPPYLLAFGREKAEPGQLELSQVAPGFAMSELQKLEQVTPGPARQIAGSNAASPSAAAQANTSAQQKTLILWGVLLLGVGVLALMVRSLLKQMKQPMDQQTKPQQQDSTRPETE
jgi:hypothetical protein